MPVLKTVTYFKHLNSSIKEKTTKGTFTKPEMLISVLQVGDQCFKPFIYTIHTFVTQFG